MSPRNRLIQVVILKLLFMFISVIFERLARKGRSSYGKIITHSEAEVSMNESIYSMVKTARLCILQAGPYLLESFCSFTQIL